MTVLALDRRSGLVVALSPTLINLGLMATHGQLAAGYLGSRRLSSSGSYHYVLAWAPLHAWGWALLLGGLLCAATPWLRRRAATAARILAAAPLLALMAAFAAAQLGGYSEGWGGIGLLAWPVAAHALLARARHHPGTTRA